MKKFKIILIIFFSLLLILSALAYAFLFFQPKTAAKQTHAPVENISFSGNPNFVISAELATTPSEWTRGLMFRNSMPADSGMLFVFPVAVPQSFWMKDTKIPLDMIFVSAAGIIVDIKNDFLPCEKDPCPSYTSVAPAQYVLEINAGFAQKEGIKIGETVMFVK